MKKKGKQDRGSTKRVITRVSEEEFAEWHHRAELMGITLSEYLRRCVRDAKIEVEIRHIIDIKALSEIAAQYGRIGNNINQIAHYLNSGPGWSNRILNKLECSMEEMQQTTKELSKVVGEINGYRKTQSNEKFQL